MGWREGRVQSRRDSRRWRQGRRRSGAGQLVAKERLARSRRAGGFRFSHFSSKARVPPPATASGMSPHGFAGHRHDRLARDGRRRRPGPRMPGHPIRREKVRVEPFPVTTGSPCRTCRVCSVLSYSATAATAHRQIPRRSESEARRLARRKSGFSGNGVQNLNTERKRQPAPFPRARRPRTTERPAGMRKVSPQNFNGRDGAPGHSPAAFAQDVPDHAESALLGSHGYSFALRTRKE